VVCIVHVAHHARRTLTVPGGACQDLWEDHPDGCQPASHLRRRLSRAANLYHRLQFRWRRFTSAAGPPCQLQALALNGLFFPTAGKILAAGLLLTWFVSELTEVAFWVGLIVPIQYGFALLAQPLIGAWLAGRRRR
jgi:hypothetical protein